MTKRENYNAILAIPAVSANQELVDFIKHEIELLDRKSASPRKLTANQVENVRLKEVIFDHLVEADKPESIAMLRAEIAELKEMNSQKIAPLLNAMVKEGKLTKVAVKKVSHWGVVGD
jgi:hypothetical protein